MAEKRGFIADGHRAVPACFWLFVEKVRDTGIFWQMTLSNSVVPEPGGRS
jgi:hypothetical protein